ncbi:glutamine amidotransferase, partial [Salmonella enterica]|uniref:glutamine amidotransferase n=1 Tax=Salmonella enterica TaxID=28901 RepID=UPI000A808D6C
TVLGGVLPVIILDGDDRVEKPEGIFSESVSPEHPVFVGFSVYPVFLGYNQSVARDVADFVLTIKIFPFFVFVDYQRVKAACFMSDCSPRWGTEQFMSSPFYADLWVNTRQFIAR